MYSAIADNQRNQPKEIKICILGIDEITDTETYSCRLNAPMTDRYFSSINVWIIDAIMYFFFPRRYKRMCVNVFF